MKLIVGLGNPGKEYLNTRHNIGFMCIDKLSEYYNFKTDKKKFNGLYTIHKIKNEDVIFLKPQKYMNLSGEVIINFIKYFKIDISDILIISDDLDLDVGKIRIRYKGSSGGHNGLKNISQHLGTNDYKRIKIGISNNKELDTKDFVLGKFSSEEQEILLKTINLIPKIIDDYLLLSFDNLMNKYN